jgi:CheY-specific phosphatase CheX
MTQSVTGLSNNAQSSSVVNSTQLTEISSDLLDSMLGIEVNSFETSGQSIEFDEASAWRARIAIAGSWNAVVETIVTGELASRITCAMFDMTPDELTEEDCSDAIGEVVNIIGGNIKGVVGGECDLHLPCVGKYSAQDDEVQNLQIAAHCGDGSLILSVAE